jgi:serine/threonine protein kinase
VPEFRIQRCLGRGGFGEVYKAVMSRGNGVEMDVAIKVLRSDLDPSSQGIQRLRDEGRLLGRMTHPSILRVYDLVVIEGHAALVSEYVAGDDLTRILKEDPIPQRAAFEIVAQVAAALDAAWSHPSVADGKPLHLVHRDIKPDNVRIDPFGAVKLLDFGIAQASRVRREAHTSVNTIMGSTQYLSPERLVQQEIGPEADVFALGCTAFEVLAGETLFVRKSMRQMYLLMVDEDRFESFVAERCASHHHRLGDAGVSLVRDMTTYDKRRRPTAGEVATRCDTAADNMTGPTLRSWCRTRTWSPPPEMTGPLEGLSFVVHTGSGVGPLPPTATARHLLPTAATTDDQSATPEPAPTQAITRPFVDEQTLSDLDSGPVPDAPVPASALPPPPDSGPSPWTSEERAALGAGPRSPTPSEMELLGDHPGTSDPAPEREVEPEVDTDPSVHATSTSLGLPAPEQVPDDLPEPPGTQRLPVLERQRSPELWPLPMVTATVGPTEEVPTHTVLEDAITGEVTVRVRRVPRKRADGSVAPRRRLTRSSSGAPLREVTRELPLAEALAEPTVRVLAPGRERDEPTLSGRDATWPGRAPDEDDTSSDPRPNLAVPAARIDEVPPPPASPEEDLLEAGEATTGSLHLASGIHAAAARPAHSEATVPPQDDDSEQGDATLPDDRPAPTAPQERSSELKLGARGARAGSYTSLVASAGGLAGLLLGVTLLLLVLLVVWLAR